MTIHVSHPLIILFVAGWGIAFFFGMFVHNLNIRPRFPKSKRRRWS